MKHIPIPCRAVFAAWLGVCVVVLIGVATSDGIVARADQNDSRLDDLFERLQETENRDDGREITARIHQIWRSTDNKMARKFVSLGIRSIKVRLYDRALASFDRVIEIDPDYVEGWSKRAAVHYLLGNYDKALADIERTLELEPRHFAALSELGAIRMRQERDEAALDAFERALEINPHLRGAQRNIETIRQRRQGLGV